MAIFALFIYAPKGVAQGFVEPTKHTRDYYPDEGFSNVTLFEIVVFGNESSSSSGAIFLRSVGIQLDPSNFQRKISDLKISVYQESLDNSKFYNGDIEFDTLGYSLLSTDFRLYKKKFIQKFKITADIYTGDLKYGDRLNVKVELGMGIDGVTPEYYYPEIQSLIYRGGKSSSVNKPYLTMVNIFPNPFVNIINVNLPKIENITITNSIGRIVYSGPSGPIETSSFPSGVYFVRSQYGICKVVKYHN